MSNRVVVSGKVLAAKDDEISQLIKENSKLKEKITNLERPDLWRRIQQLETSHGEPRLEVESPRRHVEERDRQENRRLESSRGFGGGELLQDGGRRIEKEGDDGDEKDAEIKTRRARTKSERAEHDEIMQLYAEGKDPLAPHFRPYGRSA